MPAFPKMRPRQAEAIPESGLRRPIAAFGWAQTGVKTVTFTDASTDPDGTIESREWDFGDQPRALFSAAPDGLTVRFRDESTGAIIVGWLWDFGDATTSTAQHPTHLYASGGIKVVTLTVTDSNGITSTVTAQAVLQVTALGAYFGPFNLYTETQPTPPQASGFTSSVDNSSPSNILALLENWRQHGHQGIVKLTNGYAPYVTDGLFDVVKWQARMDQYNTTAITAAVKAAIQGGWCIGSSLIDEPNRNSTDGNNRSWGPKGFMTKARIDDLATRHRLIFPDCPTIVIAKHTWRTLLDPSPPASGPVDEHYNVVDCILSQTWRTDFPPPAGDTPDAFRDQALGVAAADGTRLLLSINIYSGPGNELAIPPCPGTLLAPNRGSCMITRTDLEAWGTSFLSANGLGRQAAGVVMWQYHPEIWATTSSSPGGDRKAGMAVLKAFADTQPKVSLRRP